MRVRCFHSYQAKVALERAELEEAIGRVQVSYNMTQIHCIHRKFANDLIYLLIFHDFLLSIGPAA